MNGIERLRRSLLGRIAIRALYRAALPVTLLTWLSACAVGPDFVAPDAPAVKHYNRGSDPARTEDAHGASQTFASGANLPADWWRLFHSDELSKIVQDGTGANPGIEEDEARLRAASDNLTAGYGIFYPAAAAAAGASRQQYSALKAGQDAAPSIFNLFTLSATVSYTLDIFGGGQRTVEVLTAQTDFARNNLRAAMIALSSNIVNTVIARAAYSAELDVTRDLIGVEKEQVHVAEVQAEAGTASYAGVLTLQSQLATLTATVSQLEQQRDETDNVLATLIGKTPSEWTSPEIALQDIALPRELPVSLPSNLVRQRPDILAAEATLHGASAEIGVATAAMLPSITLSGGYGANNDALGNLLAKNGNFWSVGVNAVQPLFDGGTLLFKRKAAADDYQASLADYRGVVLAAFAQVADVLRALDHDALILSERDQAMAASDQALHLAQANYQAGLVDYNTVLIADIQFHQARLTDIQAIALRLQDTVALYAALGGGWWNADPALAEEPGQNDAASMSATVRR